MTKIFYPVRCKIVDPEGSEIKGTDLKRVAPEKSLRHIGKEGMATLNDGNAVLISLDDGTFLYGSECWWVPTGPANPMELLVRLLAPDFDRLRKVVSMAEKNQGIEFAIEANSYSGNTWSPLDPSDEEDLDLIHDTSIGAVRIPIETVKEFLAKVDQSED